MPHFVELQLIPGFKEQSRVRLLGVWSGRWGRLREEGGSPQGGDASNTGW